MLVNCVFFNQKLFLVDGFQGVDGVKQKFFRFKVIILVNFIFVVEYLEEIGVVMTGFISDMIVEEFDSIFMGNGNKYV